jgi:histidine phosphotransferase ChpT
MDEIRIAELLASRLCHELAGPLGAVGNGLELLALEGRSAEGGADLAERSAQRAIALLQFYRVAYGRSAAANQDNNSHLRELANAALGDERLRLDWPDDLRIPVAEDAGRLLLNMVAIAAGALPRGGVVSLSERPADREAGVAGINVAAQGELLRLSEELAAALRPDFASNDLTPRNAHGYLTRALAGRIGGDLRVGEDAGRLVLSLDMPAEGASA